MSSSCFARAAMLFRRERGDMARQYFHLVDVAYRHYMGESIFHRLLHEDPNVTNDKMTQSMYVSTGKTPGNYRYYNLFHQTAIPEGLHGSPSMYNEQDWLHADKFCDEAQSEMDQDILHNTGNPVKRIQLVFYLRQKTILSFREALDETNIHGATG